MPREITHAARGPKTIDEEDLAEKDGKISICMCGLSNNYPFCDDSHISTADEDADVLYKYEEDDDDNPRHEIEEIVFADGG